MTPQSPISRPGYFPPPPPSATENQPIAKWVWVVGAVMVALVIACGFAAIPLVRSFRGASGDAHAMVDTLHGHMAAGDMAAIFNEADPAWRQQVGREDSDKLFRFVHDKMGNPGSSTLVSWFSNDNATTGSLRTWVFNTTFDKGMGTETVVARKSGKGYRLLRYVVQSPLISPAEVPKELDPRRPPQKLDSTSPTAH